MPKKNGSGPSAGMIWKIQNQKYWHDIAHHHLAISFIFLIAWRGVKSEVVYDPTPLMKRFTKLTILTGFYIILYDLDRYTINFFYTSICNYLILRGPPLPSSNNFGY